MDRLTELDPARLARLQGVGILSGFAAGAWLGAAEAPTKLVTLGIQPVVISFMMVIGVFLARWSLPALVRGTAAVRDDVRQAPHLVIWAALAGCLWAVANTLTIFAIKDIGLAIAFPLWNANSLLGILWGMLLFNELRDAGRGRRLAVWGGAVVMFAGATLLAVASSSATRAGGDPVRGIAAALTAGVGGRRARARARATAWIPPTSPRVWRVRPPRAARAPAARRSTGCWSRGRRRCSWGSPRSPGCRPSPSTGVGAWRSRPLCSPS